MEQNTATEREAWIVEDINGDIHEGEGTFETLDKCEQHIRERLDSDRQREDGEDSMYAPTLVPAAWYAIEGITAHADKVDTRGASDETVNRWHDAVGAGRRSAEDREADRGRPSTTKDAGRLANLISAADAVRNERQDPGDPLGTERVFNSLLTLGSVRLRLEGIDRSQAEPAQRAGQEPVSRNSAATAGAPDIDAELRLYSVRYSAGGANECGWYLEKQAAETNQLEWVRGPGTVDNVARELQQELEKNGHENVVDPIRWWAKERMDAARRTHVMEERPAQARAAGSGQDGEWPDDAEPVTVRLSVDGETGKLQGELPMGVKTHSVRDPSYMRPGTPGYGQASERSGFLVESRRAIDLVVEVPGNAPGTNITLSCSAQSNVELQGAGGGDVVHLGPGPGNAIRRGTGTGSASREGGRGSAVRTGTGQGNAVRSYRGQGNATRADEGNGDAIRTDQGDGDARREGSGRGNATRNGSGTGDAIVDSSAEGTARLGGDVRGNATRAGTGEGDALVTERAEGNATVASEPRGSARNTSSRPGDACNGSIREGDAQREGEGAGSAIRTGAGHGNATRGGNAKGHAWRGGGGNGHAWNATSEAGNAARTGAGTGEARSQGRYGYAWNEERPTPPVWLEDLAETMQTRRTTATHDARVRDEDPGREGAEGYDGPERRKPAASPENAEAWVIGDINADVEYSAGLFASKTACYEHIHHHLDGNEQREYGKDSMYTEIPVPASREAVRLIHGWAGTLETDPNGPGREAAHQWDQAMQAAAGAMPKRGSEDDNEDYLERPPETPSTTDDHKRLCDLVAAAAKVHANRATPLDPIGPERELIAALELGTARIETTGRARDERDNPDGLTRHMDRAGGGATTPATAPPRAAGSSASKSQPERQDGLAR